MILKLATVAIVILFFLVMFGMNEFENFDDE